MYNSGVRGRRGADGYGVISGRDQFIQTKLSYPSITGYNACNVSQVILDDTAVTPGGYMLLYGTAFTTGMTLTIGTATVSSYTLVNTGRIFLTVPITLITGTYNVSIFSSTGGGAIFTTLLVSGFPTFTQTSYTVLGTTVVNVQLLVSGDAPLTYSLGSASTLPPGVSLSGTGLLSGTISPFSGNAQTYSFNINVDDAQAQTTTQLITLSVQLGDTYWPNNTLLLDSNTPGNVNTFVTDASLNNNIATIFGDTRPSNLNPYQAGYYSNYFDGTGDYLNTPATGQFAPTGDFTIRLSFYITSLAATNHLIGNYTANLSTDWLIEVLSTGVMQVFLDGATLRLQTTGITINQWYYVTITRSGSTVTGQINGTNFNTTATYTMAATLGSATKSIYLGMRGGSTNPLFGYLSNVSLVSGSAITAVPTTPLTAVTGTSLLTCQSNRLIDNSLNNFAITKNGDTTVQSFNPFGVPTTTTVNTLYSTYFDGTGDSIRISPDNAVFQMGTGDFTVEAWVNPTALSATDARIWSYQDTGGSAINLSLLATGSASVFSSYIRSNGATGANQTNGTTTAVVGTWYHVAFSRYSGTTKLFVNGIQEGSTGTTQTQNVTAGAAAIGYYPTSPSEYITGYVSNIRIVKGVGVYTGNFTVPTSNLTATQSSGTNIAAITGLQTSLLTCQNSTIIDNSNNALTSSISSNGDARPLAVSPFTQTTTSVSLTNLGSSYFDGTGDYIAFTAGPVFAPNLGPFTVEGWYYSTAASGTQQIWAQTVSGTNYFIVLFDPSALYFAFAGIGYPVYSPATVKPNCWNHFAVVRDATNITVYANGVAGSPVAFGSGYNFNNTTYVPVMSGYTHSQTAMMTGYLANFRYVKGTALYTANFAPPVQPLTAVTNTSLLTLQTSQPTNNSMFVDNSSLSSIVTRTGNVSQGSFNPYGLNWSNYFDGTGDYVTTPANAALDLGSSDFTIEMWVYPTTTGAWWLLGKGDASTVAGSSYSFYMGGSTWDFYYGSTALQITKPTLDLNAWQHIAVVRSTITITIYKNGTSVSTGNIGANSINTGGGNPLSIGSYSANGIVGYISNFRLVNGTAVYTTNFAPPTTPLTPINKTSVLTCQSAGFVDNSGNNFVVTRNGDTSVQRFNPFGTTTQSPLSYGGFFDGSGDYMTVPYSSAFDLSTGDWTMEAWFNARSFGSHIIAKDTQGVNWDWNMCIASATSLNIYTAGTAQNLTATVPTMSINTWYHFAICRTGTATRIFLNGIQYATSNLALTNASATTPTIGCNSYNAPSGFFSGFISNLRVVKGVGVYSETFTPPTTPFTSTQTANSNGNPSAAITGTATSLLTCQSSTFIDNSTNALTITVLGDTKPKTFNPFGVTTTQGQAYTPALFGGSGYFDGTGDYLQLATNNSQFNQLYSTTVPFTIECWVYMTIKSADANTFISTYGGGGAYGWRIELHSDGNVYWVSNGANTAIYYAVPLNSWNHLAFVWNGTTIKMYLNGGNVASGATSWTNNTEPLWIGSMQASGQYAFAYFGYISDVRITRATQVYTTPFVPPQSPLTATTGTVLFLNMTKAGIPDYTRSIDLETVGDARITTESAYNGNYYSNYFNVAVGDQLSVPNNSVFDFVANNFTMEGWVYQISSAGVDQPIIAKYSANPSSFIIETVNGNWFATIYYGGGASALQIANGSTAIVLGTWNHWACTRNGANFYFYVNGVQIGTAAAQTINTSTWAVVIGGADGRNMYWPGYISNIRVVNGQALVTGTFTPSTTPLTATTVGHTGAGAAASITGTVALLTCQSNKLVDNSSNNFTLTRIGAPLVKSLNPFILNTPTSMSFDGTGDYLANYTTPQTAAFGTGDFTIEMWVYVNTLATLQVVIDCRPATTNGAYLTLYITTSGTIIWQTSATSQITSSAIVTGAWYYVAVSRSGASTRMFINGTQTGSTYTDSTNYVVSRIVIGANSYTLGIDPLNGYLEDLRITKGVARYAGAFTPPTAKLPTF